MDRRDVVWINHQIREIEQSGHIVQKGSDRPAVLLLRTSAAKALGFQSLLQGTTHSSAGARAAVRTELLEFSSNFVHYTKPDEVRINFWKGHQILVSSSVKDDSYRGSVPAGWNRQFSQRLAALLSDETLARSMLSAASMRPPSLRQHPAVRTLAPASIVRYRNKLAFVISNAEIHARHPYSPVVVAPLVERSELRQDADPAIFLGQDRVAYEVSQTIEPLDNEVFDVLQEPSDATTATLAPVRAAASTLLLGESPVQQKPGEFLAYLIEAGTELRQRGLYHLGPLAEPKGYPAPPSMLAVRRSLPPTGRAYDAQGGVAVGGRDFFQLPANLLHFDVWLERLEASATVHIEAKPLPSNYIEHAWIEDADGVFIASFQQDETAADAHIATLPSGPITTNGSQAMRLGVCSPLGIAMLDLELYWALPGSI
jgi:hypothetical protein